MEKGKKSAAGQESTLPEVFYFGQYEPLQDYSSPVSGTNYSQFVRFGPTTGLRS